MIQTFNTCYLTHYFVHPPAQTVHITKLLKLLGQTMYLINKRTCSGLELARLVGHWTWVIMLRRPTFAIIRNTYIFIERYKGRKHQLWPSVIDELY
jgi:hypothetical protein